jgi:nucleotide-binding universal stress UspA family protein
MMIKKILVAIDGSEPADKALDYALDLAESLGAEILILSVAPLLIFPIVAEDPNVPPLVTAREIDRMSSRITSIHEGILKEALAKAQSKKPGLIVSTELAEGRPADEIVEIAEAKGFDLIVMGSRGLHGFSEFLLGSTTHRVADHCKKPLLIVK